MKNTVSIHSDEILLKLAKTDSTNGFSILNSCGKAVLKK